MRYQREMGLTLVEVVIVILALVVLAVFVVPAIQERRRPHPRSILSRAQSDLRSLATCLESYYVDNGAYPVHATGAEGANAISPQLHAYYITTFRVKLGPADPIHTLTTPISYCTTYFSDPYAGGEGITFGYFNRDQETSGSATGGWLMWSPGPDRDYDIDPAADYIPLEIHPSPSLIHNTYDPTNGTISDGDVWRAKQ